MNDLSTQAVLYLTAGMVGVVLLIFGVFLARRGRFHWLSSGFWAWSSFAVYFVTNPLAVALSGTNLDRYAIRLDLGGGPPRGLWVLAVTLIGIAVFFWRYLRAPDIALKFKVKRPAVINIFGALVFTGWLLISFYSLIVFRTLRDTQEVLIVRGRFIGDVTGYQNSGYMFLFVPLAILLLSEHKLVRWSGWLVAILTLFLALPYGWARFVIVSLVILLSLTATLRSRRNWPTLGFIILIVFVTGGLQVRGHAAVSLDQVGESVYETALSAINAPLDVLAGQDTAMLATFYLESFLHDRIIGYEYGLPLLNYVLSGWIPSRFFPQKYFIIDWLQSRRPNYPPIIDSLLYGGKASLVGNLYMNASLIGVILGMGWLGILSRKLDMWVRFSNDVLVQAFALGVLSQLWIMWGSGLTWVLIRLGFLGLPAISLGFARRWSRTRYAEHLQATGILAHEHTIQP